MKETIEYLNNCDKNELREVIKDYKYILSKYSLRGVHEDTQILLNYALNLLKSK